MKRTTVPASRLPKGRALTHATTALLGLTLTAALAYTPAASMSAPRTEKVNDARSTSPNPDPAPPPQRSPAPGAYAATQAAAGPVASEPFFCEEEAKPNVPLTLVTLTFTKPLPKGAWLGKLHTLFADNTSSERDVQLFAPTAVPEGTEWSFQTTNGRLHCKLIVYKGGKELRFTDCTNRSEQYCLSQSITKITSEVMPECVARCGGRPFLEQPQCYAVCAEEIARREAKEFSDALDCSGFLKTLKCWGISLMIWIAKREGPDARTRLALDELYRNWVNFVNRSHGFGRGNSCEGRGYLCPVGTQCIGSSCKIVKN